MSEQSCRNQFTESLLIRFGRFERLLHLLGPADRGLFPAHGQTDEADGPADTLVVRVAGGRSRKPIFAPFSQATYYELNPDVAAHRIEALKHYFRHGYDEGQSVRTDNGRKDARA